MAANGVETKTRDAAAFALLATLSAGILIGSVLTRSVSAKGQAVDSSDARPLSVPAPVTLSCFGSQFENESDDDLRIDFGLDSKFLPSPDVEGSLRIQQSNLRSLLYLGAQIEKNLPLERRLLWSESGANFAEVLEETLEQLGGIT